MTEQPEQQTEHQPADHLRIPKELSLDNQRVRVMYEWLRSANPWLPDSKLVSAAEDLKMSFGIDSLTTLTLTVLINIPGGSDDGSQAEEG